MVYAPPSRTGDARQNEPTTNWPGLIVSTSAPTLLDDPGVLVPL
jgi:hypothetical protein